MGRSSESTSPLRGVRHLVGETADRDIDNARALEMDGQTPDFPPRSFDPITGGTSIPMIPDRPSAFARLLRRGCTPASRVPACSSADTVLSFFQDAMMEFTASADPDTADEVTTLVDYLRAVGFATFEVTLP